MLSRIRSVVTMSRKKSKAKFEKGQFKIDAELLNKPCYELANYLLGKLLVRKWDNIITKGRIVETECYLGGEDKASNTFGGRYVNETIRLKIYFDHNVPHNGIVRILIYVYFF